MKKQTNKKLNGHRLTVYISPSLNLILRKHVKRQARTLSQITEWALFRYLEANQNQQTK